MWPSRSSAIKLFIAPLAALITCRTSEQSRSSSKARTRASTCPRMRLALRRRFCFSLTVWLIVERLQYTIRGMVVYLIGMLYYDHRDPFSRGCVFHPAVATLFAFAGIALGVALLKI